MMSKDELDAFTNVVIGDAKRRLASATEVKLNPWMPANPPPVHVGGPYLLRAGEEEHPGVAFVEEGHWVWDTGVYVQLPLRYTHIPEDDAHA